mgnify:CR=1 FL=1
MLARSVTTLNLRTVFAGALLALAGVAASADEAKVQPQAGEMAPAISLPATGYGFGNQIAGSPSPSQPMTITNSGNRPLTVTSIAPMIMRHGTEQNKREFLPLIARGEMTCALGYSEPDAGTDLAITATGSATITSDVGAGALGASGAGAVVSGGPVVEQNMQSGVMR